MRKAIIALGVCAAIGLSACATDPYAAGSGYGGTQLSQCMRNALIGAAGGAVLGGVAASKGVKTEGAVLGAAVGGGAAYALCRYMTPQSQTTIEGAYLQALNSNSAVTKNVALSGGQSGRVSVQRPVPANQGCMYVNGTLSVGGQAPQSLPQETYCRDQGGVWRPGLA